MAMWYTHRNHTVSSLIWNQFARVFQKDEILTSRFGECNFTFLKKNSVTSATRRFYSVNKLCSVVCFVLSSKFLPSSGKVR